MKSQVINMIALAALGCVMHISALPLTRERRETAPTHKSIKVSEGQPINMNCNAWGTYPAIFHWLYNNDFVEQGPHDKYSENVMSIGVKHIYVEDETSFYIKNSKPEDSGKYTCVGQTMTLTVYTVYTVTVEPATKKADLAVKSSSDLRIYQWTKTVMQNMGEHMRVVCRATQGLTEKPPTIHWTIGSTRIIPTDNIKIHENGDLEVFRLDPDFVEGDGSLGCHATGTDGHTVTKKTFIYAFPTK